MSATITLPRVSVPDEGAEWLAWARGDKFARQFRDATRVNDEIIDHLQAQVDRGIPVIAGGASTYPFEGIDVMLNTVFRKVVTQSPDPMFLGLFTSQTATTVPAQTATLGATPVGVTEAVGGGYARASTPSTSWPAPTTTNVTGRTTDMTTPISFAESTGAYTVNAQNGFFLATAATAGIALFYSNFLSGVAIVINQAGVTVRIDAAAEIRG